MSETVNLKTLTEEQRIAALGAMFAMSAIDGDMDQSEVSLIFDLASSQELSDEGENRLRSFLAEPPDLGATLTCLEDADGSIRFGLMMSLTNVALADERIDEEEEGLLRIAQRKLGVNADQAEAMLKFLKEVKDVQRRGLDDSHAAEALKSAAAGLTGVGVPIAAVYVSGSVMGLSAAGITSGLAAVGLGMGMVPGIGVAVLLGVGIFVGIRKVLSLAKEGRRTEHRLREERKAQLVIKNLQASLNDLVDRVSKLRETGDQSEANREAIRALTERMRALQQAVELRRTAIAAS